MSGQSGFTLGLFSHPKWRSFEKYGENLGKWRSISWWRWHFDVYTCVYHFFRQPMLSFLSLTSKFLSSVILMNNDMLMTITSSGHICEYLAIISIICYNIKYQHVPTLISSQFWLDDLHHLSSSSNLVSIFFLSSKSSTISFFRGHEIDAFPMFPLPLRPCPVHQVRPWAPLHVNVRAGRNSSEMVPKSPEIESSTLSSPNINYPGERCSEFWTFLDCVFHQQFIKIAILGSHVNGNKKTVRIHWDLLSVLKIWIYYDLL